jgi:hypothetical protein
VLLLIYVLVVGWFQSFTIPLVIMAPIPLTLVGILPAHALTGAFFTATSMIGMIALAGIIVRNSILLVDFIQLAEERGRPLVRGGARGGRGALPSDRAHGGGRGDRRAGDGARSDLPGARGGADGGAIVATLLTMVVVPLLYWELRRREARQRWIRRRRSSRRSRAATCSGSSPARPARPRPAPYIVDAAPARRVRYEDPARHEGTMCNIASVKTRCEGRSPYPNTR